LSTVTLEFEWGTDKKIAMIDVNNKLQQVKDLPVLSDKPTLKSVSTDNSSPIMWIVFDKPDPKMPKKNQIIGTKLGRILLFLRYEELPE
jgi:multidrug efflux pump subunit AcrB